MRTSRSHLLPVLCTLVLAAVVSSLAAGEPEPGQRPNIVYILSDDVGWGSIGCYGVDPKLVRTPNIDRLACEGRRFTDACTPSSVCSPTRYAVLTGRFCWRTPLTHQVLGVTAPLHIEPERVTVASLLKGCGYRTAAVGKWHLGYGPPPKTDYTEELKPGPLEVGFDYHFGVPSNHGDVTGVFVEDRRVAGLRSKNLEPFGKCYYGGKPFMGLDAPQREDEKVMEALTDQAVAWLEKQEAGKPFFLYFTPIALHEPSTPSQKTKGTSGCGPYGDFTHDLDFSVGRILDALDRKKLAENTLVIFTSDNGACVITEGERPEAVAYQAGLRAAGPWRGRKHTIFEGGFRVPFIARWPGHIPAGTTCDQMINLVDLFGTVAAITGTPLPPVGKGAEDTCNILPALLGQKIDRSLRDAMVQHSADGVFAVRRGDWKWIEGKPADKVKPAKVKGRADNFVPQLYNLKDDPKEERNVIAEHPNIAKDLAALLDIWRVKGHSRTE
jgi:arylsulfatase A-like enzyme